MRSLTRHTTLDTLATAALLTVAACADTGGAPLAPASSATGAIGLAGLAVGSPEYANVMNQGGAGVYAANGATLVRQPDGLGASVTVPTPQPGTYNYPAGRVSGHPEVFTLWAFVFNYPDLCSGPCDMDDLGAATPAKGGVYNLGGHVASGSSLTIAGRIGVGETPFAPATAPLESPGTAEVHLAIAPHGYVEPSNRAAEFGLPTGPSVLWWVAMFIP
jgi:hypothetical protein